jgi:hypothetical protein
MFGAFSTAIDYFKFQQMLLNVGASNGRLDLVLNS